MRTLILLLLTALFFHPVHAQCPAGLSGTYAIGPTGNFPSITRAMDTLRLKGVSGPVFFELQAGYVSTVETFPVRLTEYPCADSTRAVTIRPAANAANLQITSNHDTATIDINTGNYFIIDGRSGGTGTAKNLRISNTHINGMAIRLVNDAGYNSMRYLDIRGVTRYSGRGVVTIGVTNRTRGNDRNRLDTCLIGDGATTPSCLVSFMSAIPGNNNNLVNGCELFNFYDPNEPSSAISISTGDDSIAIIGNSIYQTAPRAYSGPIRSNVVGISVSGLVGAMFISDNFIGGSAPRAGGAKMQLTGFSSFSAMSINSRSGTPFRSIVQNNTIRNIGCVNSGGFDLVDLGTFIGNHVETFNGYFLNNTIGNPDADSSISYRSNTPSAQMNLVVCYPSNTDSVLFNNNRLGGIYADRISTSNDNVHLYMLIVSPLGTAAPWRFTIKGNEFGSTTHPRSVWNHSGGAIRGIFIDPINCACSSPVLSNTIRVEDNLISNFTVDAPYNSASVGSVRGIDIDWQPGTYLSVVNNRVNRLILDNSTVTVPAVVGIYCEVASAVNSFYEISGNVVHTLYSLKNENLQQNNVSGIEIWNTAANAKVSISRNLIHSLKASGSYATSRTVGIDNDSGVPGSIDNNMIRLGLDSAGQAITAPGAVYGILEHSGNTPTVHNTVVIAGEGVVTAPLDDYSSTVSAAFGRLQVYDPAVSYTVRNNIFVNLRTNVPVPGPMRNSAIRVAYYPTGIVPGSFNNNLYQVAPQNFLISYGYEFSLAQWQSASGQDAQAIEAVPNLVNPTGAPDVMDLHLKRISPADGAGTPASTTVTDFDGDIRSALSPVDIGADAGNYGVVTAVGQVQLQGYAINAFPNPATRDLFVRITAPATVKAQISLCNLAGQKVASREVQLLRGENNLQLKELEKAAAGTYIVELQTPKGKLQVAVVKQ